MLATDCGRKLLRASLLAGFVFLCSAASPPADDVRRDAAVQAIERAMPSVVNISAETVVDASGPFADIYRDFFGPTWGRRAEQSLGSGVIIDEEGYVITNYHVVERASRIKVRTWDGREFEAVPLVGALKSDVALLKLQAKSRFKAINFAADDDLLLGETVLALGNPFGLGESVSRGILSSRSRRPPMENEALDIQDWLQTDAAINPGNSGGPLINLHGELIGLNVAVFREGQGIGFAIPMRRLSEALGMLFTPEAIKSCWLGARFAASTNGMFASGIESGSPAEKAGLREGDRILKVNDRAPQNTIEINREFINAGDGKDVAVQVARGSEKRSFSVRMLAEKNVFNEDLIRQKLGVVLQKLDAPIATRLGLNSTDGFIVSKVEPDSPADVSGVEKGFIIRSIDGRIPGDITTVAKVLHGKKPGEKLTLSVIMPRANRRYIQLSMGTIEVKTR